MHDLHHGLVLGYHGCDKGVADALLAGKPFKPSRNPYDWLGDGVYFWERDPRRGLEFAKELASLGQKRNPIKMPSVVGAVLALGRCLDLTTRNAVELVETSYNMLVAITENNPAVKKIPQNSPDLMRRYLDKAVIETLMNIRSETDQPRFDTVRGVFEEGAPVYPGAGFKAKTHVQIAVRNTDCILGVFRVPDAALE